LKNLQFSIKEKISFHKRTLFSKNQNGAQIQYFYL
jgi:hypothetical protein